MFYVLASVKFLLFSSAVCLSVCLSLALSLSLPTQLSLCFSVPGIDLENIVYYKDDTHYFVMTAKKKSLLKKGVIKEVRTTLTKCAILSGTSCPSAVSRERENHMDDVCVGTFEKTIVNHLPAGYI